jgi:hypothetical protein
MGVFAFHKTFCILHLHGVFRQGHKMGMHRKEASMADVNLTQKTCTCRKRLDILSVFLRPLDL